MRRCVKPTLSSMLMRHTIPSRTSKDDATSRSRDDSDTGVGTAAVSISLAGAALLEVAGRLDPAVVVGKSSGGSSGQPKFSLVLP